VPDDCPRVVVVDDSTDVRVLVAAVLDHDGFHVVADVSTAEEALIAVDIYAPEIVLVDQRLESELGTDLLAQLRRSSDAVLVLLTAHVSESVRSTARECGADAIVDKAETMRLPDRLRELLAAREELAPIA